MSTNNAAHTPWRYEELHDGRESLGLRVYYGDDIACSIFGCGVTDFDNARLFTEAGTVTHETGLTPRQLAEQRAELLDSLKALASDRHTHSASRNDADVCDQCGENFRSDVHFRVGESKETDLEKARAAIAKCGVRP